MSLHTKSRFVLTSLATVAVVAIGGFAYAQTTTAPESPQRNTTTPSSNDRAASANGSMQGPTLTTPAQGSLPLGTDGRRTGMGQDLNNMPNGSSQSTQPMDSRDTLNRDQSGTISNDANRAGTTSGVSANDPGRMDSTNRADGTSGSTGDGMNLAPRADRN